MDQYHVMLNGYPQGPFSRIHAQEKIEGRGDVLVWREGFTDWRPASKVPELASTHKPEPIAKPKPKPIAPPPLEPEPKPIAPLMCDAEMQFVEIELDPQESIIAEAGALMYKDSKVEMQTIFGDGSNKGVLGKIFGAGKRVLSGESLFLTIFSNQGRSKAKVAFSAPYPGNIIPVSLIDHGGCLICQKDAFLCAARGVSIGIHLQRKILTGFFGGEGFIMQKLEGDGMAYVHAGGTIVERELGRGEELHVDTGCVVAYEQQVNFEIKLAGGVKTALFGGEGLFLAKMRGPGKIWLQSLPFSRLAGRLAEALPDRGGDKGED